MFCPNAVTTRDSVLNCTRKDIITWNWKDLCHIKPSYLYFICPFSFKEPSSFVWWIGGYKSLNLYTIQSCILDLQKLSCFLSNSPMFIGMYIYMYICIDDKKYTVKLHRKTRRNVWIRLYKFGIVRRRIKYKWENTIRGKNLHAYVKTDYEKFHLK